MRDTTSTILLTGATGLVGRYLLRDLLLKGNDLLVVARSRGPVSGQDRIEAVLQDWEKKLGRRMVRPRVIEANINEPGLGLIGSEHRLPLSRCGVVVHCAASLRFEEDTAGEEPVRTNLAGTRNVVEFAQEAAIPHFHHVSTAYVCGQRSGNILESELDCGQPFHNIYEQSKFQAEQLVAAADGFETKTVYRPSIIVGDSSSGFSSTFHTVYSILRFLRALPDNHAANLEWIFQRLKLSGREGKNLVPVDWVGRAMTDILETPSAWNRTFHLTHSRPTKVDQLCDAIAEAVEREWSSWEAMALPSSLVDAQIAYQNHVDVYRGYLNDDPTFDSANLREHIVAPEPPILNHDRLVTLFSFAIRNRFRDSTPALPRKAPPHAFRSALNATTESTAASSSKSPLAWTLRLSGAGGGIWTFNGTPSASATVHTSVEQWQALLDGTIAIDAAVKSKRLMLIGTKETWAALRAELERVLNRCRDLQSSEAEAADSDLPTVVPLRRNREGRRHA